MENTNKCAALFKLLCEDYNGSELGKKASQKLFYFFERYGITLNLRYGIHYYGPYSARLDDAMDELECEGYIRIDTSKTTHVISAGMREISEECLTESERKIAEDVLRQFGHKSPMELEALTTMDYIANSMLPSPSEKQKIIAKFKEIKGTKFRDDVIEKSFGELSSLNLISV